MERPSFFYYGFTFLKAQPALKVGRLNLGGHTQWRLSLKYIWLGLLYVPALTQARLCTTSELGCDRP
jgi:hypothetical protein